jgi:H+-translocating NAD(P) transhydrogenase subunit beta
MSSQAWINLAYLVASMLFIVAFKLMTGPRTAVKGNYLGAVGMAIAILAACFEQPVVQSVAARGATPIVMLAVAGIIGAAIGATMAIKYPMTGMPQMVALLNGFGGAASALVAGAELWTMTAKAKLTGEGSAASLAEAATQLAPWSQFAIATALTGLIGAVTFWGSFVAFAKLEELPRFKKAWTDPNRHMINLGLAIATLALIGGLCAYPTSNLLYWLLVIVGSALGCTLTLPIGGADMPVVICLLNSYSGLAAAAAGFVIDNNVLVIAGSLVGASGLILTAIMCQAMNRSLVGVLFGGLGTTTAAAGGDDIYAGKVKSASAEEIAMVLEGADRVVIVPGYGLAVAQAQHAVRELANALEKRGTTVEYAIHPVAGRMPGHMNVLLAEADIPYEKLREMDDINPTFPETDVAIVIGANDVVNPAARTDPKSPIAGMPVLDVDKARTVVVVKRSLSPGFAGIPNPLFAADNTLMYFADGKKAILDLTNALSKG